MENWKDWEEFFKRWPKGWEKAYQAIKARLEAEAEDKVKERFPLYCRCPYPYETTTDNGICRFLGDTDVCTHPSNKSPEPECEHTDHYQRIPDGYTTNHEAVGTDWRRCTTLITPFTYCTKCDIVLSIKKPECEHLANNGLSYKDWNVGYNNCPKCGKKL